MTTYSSTAKGLVSGAYPPALDPNSGMVVAKGVCKSFGETKVLQGVDMVVPAGEVRCLMGPSGSGKSTFLRCLNHLERIDDGWIVVNKELLGVRLNGSRLHVLPERDVAQQRRHVGMVFQHFNLFPHMTCVNNVAIGLRRVRRQSRHDADRNARMELGRVGLADKCDSYPAELSGGQRQRVAIARMLAMEPKVLLFDEPTSALDPELVGEVLSVMRELAGQQLTMIVVTHEVGFARQVADVVAFMDEGRIIESGPPTAILDSPKHARTVEFMSKIL